MIFLSFVQVRLNKKNAELNITTFIQNELIPKCISPVFTNKPENRES